jgi:hypothetical protein
VRDPPLPDSYFRGNAEYAQCKYLWKIKVDGLVKSPSIVTPAEAGVQNVVKELDSGESRNPVLFPSSKLPGLRFSPE